MLVASHIDIISIKYHTLKSKKIFIVTTTGSCLPASSSADWYTVIPSYKGNKKIASLSGLLFLFYLVLSLFYITVHIPFLEFHPKCNEITSNPKFDAGFQMESFEIGAVLKAEGIWNTAKTKFHTPTHSQMHTHTDSWCSQSSNQERDLDGPDTHPSVSPYMRQDLLMFLSLFRRPNFQKKFSL